MKAKEPIWGGFADQSLNGSDDFFFKIHLILSRFRGYTYSNKYTVPHFS